MRFILAIALCLGTVSSLELSLLDEEACVTIPATPITRVIEASTPQLFSPPLFNFTEPDLSTYPDNTICQWSVYLTDYTEQLTLGFYNFSVEDDLSCDLDNVTVWDGPDDSVTPIAVLCGELGNLPDYFTASNGSLFVRFQSNGNGIAGKGFAARVAPPSVNTACDGTGPQVFTNPIGTFQTKNYPINYDNNVLCEYSFQAPAGQRVELSFQDSDMSQNCNDDYMEVYEGDQLAFGEFAARFSGNQIPAAMSSVANNAYIRFVSNEQRTSTGFFGSYRFV